MSPIAAEFVDFHCHLDLYPDFEALVAECEAQRIFTLGVTTTPAAWPKNRALTTSTRYVRSALGLHPQLVSVRADEVSLWDQYFDEARYIGEVGLDFGPQYFKSAKQQRDVFEHVARQCARAGNKILTVHSVRAATAVLDTIETYLAKSGSRVILHWFTGTAREAARAIELGCYFSVNQAMLDKPRNRAIVTALPLERILTETDGPFTTAGRTPARPSDVETAVTRLSEIFALTCSDMAGAIRNNLRTVVSA
ncbi:MAG TPA: Qat anti-phage system TatD family nuclease QatD [Usitatibacter sp.]|jgi:TatD DNase family protein|nr:Qat anti-phage system TatD family nuclease QatD [Usitatibacter sp.]